MPLAWQASSVGEPLCIRRLGQRPRHGNTLNNCTFTGNSAAFGGGACQSTLNNCSFSGNSANNDGGGAYNSTLNNCTIVSNSATQGGAAQYGALYNCTIVGNSATYGGGTLFTTLYNCTVVGNSAGISGGGDYGSTLINSVVYFNSAPSGSNWFVTVAFTNTCTVPAATNGPGNITNDPMFIANGINYGTNHIAGNYRLRDSSPCLNAGTNFAWMTNTNDVRSVDLDGNPRIRYGTVDMGAYETLLRGTTFTFY